MRRLLYPLLMCFLLLLCFQVKAEKQLAIIASKNSDISTLDEASLQAVFLGLLTKDPQLRTLKPVDLHNSDDRDFFYQILVGRNRHQMQAYWSRMSFTGRGRPPTELEVKDLIAALENNPRLIAYVPTDLVNDKVKVLMFIP